MIESKIQKTEERFDELRTHTIKLLFVGGVTFSDLDSLAYVLSLFMPISHAQKLIGRNWLLALDKMHMAMGAIKQSGDSDVDFVRLMLPHHQAAIDMAKTQLLHGKDPQIRRLAQEIITDQQLEIQLMQRWLKQQHVN